ncbi:hypothetical protein PRIC2_006373 [Phytophthora ramorum]
MDAVDADEPEIPSRTNVGDQLFDVVYDPGLDRFFLEDEALHSKRSCTLKRKGISMPWEKWITPPKVVTKPDEQEGVNDTDFPLGEPGSVPASPIENTLAQQWLTPSVVDNGEATQIDISTQVPALDFSSFQKPLTEASADKLKTIVDSAATVKPKKNRVHSYPAHFKKINQQLASAIAAGAATAESSDDHEVKWDGEVIHVQVPGLRPKIERSVGRGSDKRDALQAELVHSSEDQWPGSTYELKNLMRIRAHADGLRGVNTACHFVAVSSSEEEQEQEQEQEFPEQHESEEESDLMPVFFRDDRVLFRANRRWFKGTVRRRIPSSDFYNIRADNGTLFEAVLASNIELLDEPTELLHYHYRKGDKVLWVPESKNTATNSSRANTARISRHQRRSNNTNEELTYKAKIMLVRSLNRFDLLLRTGRVLKKVPREQLRPRDASDFVSATVARRR